MAVQTFMLPDLGEGLTEAVIMQWFVKVGDTVATDQVIAEVETAKSIVELPTPYAGTVVALHGAEGETISTGSPVLEVEDGVASESDYGGGEDQGSAPAGATEGPADRTEVEAYRAEERAGSGNVLIGYGTESVAAKGRRKRKGSSGAAASGGASVTAESLPTRRTVAVRSPIVRRLAKELGVDPRNIAATGSDGAVTRADVLRAAQGAQSATVVLSDGAEVAGLHGLRLRSKEPFSPLRKAVSKKLSQSRSEIPEATVWVDVDFTNLWQLRPLMVAEGERPPSITTLVARFALLVLGDYPLLASRVEDDALVTFDGVNLGVAVDSERGLSVPVLPRADELNIAELDAALRELSAEARTGRLAPTRLSGSTFTFNNYGGFGVDGSAAIINHPEVAILGMGRVLERPWVVQGEIAVRRIAQLSLVFDHRVCDGGYAAGFLGSLVKMIENPMLVYGRL